jgi:hypothetical protein
MSILDISKNNISKKPVYTHPEVEISVKAKVNMNHKKSRLTKMLKKSYGYAMHGAEWLVLQ